MQSTTHLGPKPPFRRSRNKVIAGVCAGCADWLRWSPATGRFAFALFSVMSVIVPGIVVYLIVWTIMPKPPAGDSAAD